MTAIAHALLNGGVELDEREEAPVPQPRQDEALDELWTKINIEFYKDGADAVFKALVE